MKKLMILAVGLAMLNLTSCKKGEEDPGMTLRSRAGRLAGTWTATEMAINSIEVWNNDDVDTYTGGTDQDTYNSKSTMDMSFDGSSLSITQVKESDDSQSSTGNATTTSSSTITTTMSGSIYNFATVDISGGATSTSEKDGTYSSTASIKFTFEKDGTFSKTMTITQNTAVTGKSFNNEPMILPADYKEENSTTTEIIGSGTWSFINKNKSEDIKNKERILLVYDSDKETSTDINTQNYGFGNPDKVTTTVTTKEFMNEQEIWNLVMLKSKEMKMTFETSSSNVTTEEGSSNLDTDTSTETYTTEETETGSASFTKD